MYEMRPVLFDEHDDTTNIPDPNPVDLLRHSVRQINIVRDPRQLNTLTMSGQPYQHITVQIGQDKRGVYAQVTGHRLRRPAARERLPRLLHTLETEVAEVRLQQLVGVLAELHVEVALEHLTLSLRHPTLHRVTVQVDEDLDGRLAEYPRALVPRHHLDAETEIAVSGEDVDGAAHLQLAVVLGVVAVRTQNGQQHQELRPAPHPRGD